MKKFLKNKATMIGSIVAAAVVFILLVAFCVRPVSVGYTYSYKGDLRGVKDLTIKAHVNTFDKVTLTILDKDGEEIEDMSGEYWYFEKDGLVVTSYGLGATTKDMKKSEWKEWKEEVLEDWDKEEVEEAAKAGSPIVFKSNAFKMVVMAEEFYNAGAFVTVSVLAVVDAVLVAGAVASIILRKKNA